jgi:hypothetical protein
MRLLSISEWLCFGVAGVSFCCWMRSSTDGVWKDMFGQFFTAGVTLYAANRIARSVAASERHGEVIDDVVKSVGEAADRLLDAGLKRMEAKKGKEATAATAAATEAASLLTRSQGLLAACVRDGASVANIRRHCMSMKKLLTDDVVDEKRREEANAELRNLHQLLLRVRLSG